MKKELLKAITIISVTTILVVGVVFYQKDQKVLPTDTTKNESYKAEYMGGCYDGTNYEFCSCSFDKLEQEFGLAEMSKMGIEYDLTGVIPEKALESIEECL